MVDIKWNVSMIDIVNDGNIVAIHRYETLETTIELLPHIAHYLEESLGLRQAGNANGDAMSLLKSITSFEFIVGLILSHSILGVTKDLCSKLQSE